MTRFGSLILCATLSSAFLACGSSTSSTSTKDPLDLVPRDNDVSGWTVDQSANQTPGQRAMIATSCGGPTDPNSISKLIDGGDHAFCYGPAPKEFLWQNYLNSSLPAAPGANGATVSLYIVQMASADQATGLYTGILQFSDHKSSPWEEPSTPLVGTDSRIQDTGSQWWINFRQDVYYIEILLAPSDPAPDYTPGNATTKQAAFGFAQWVASKI